jgi:acetyltransferase-like isoleucine patch superfamily enzyme
MTIMQVGRWAAAHGYAVQLQRRHRQNLMCGCIVMQPTQPLHVGNMHICCVCMLFSCICMQRVTLGGTGKESGDRHPKIADNVLIGACTTVLGNIPVGEGALIAPGSLVLKPVASYAMVAGSPAKQVGERQLPLLVSGSLTTSHVADNVSI